MSDESVPVRDTLAERLEQAGLWHRAARRWSEVLLKCRSEEPAGYIRKRQKWCLDNALLPAPEPLNLAEVLLHATDALEDMGLQLAAGDAFRLLTHRRGK